MIMNKVTFTFKLLTAFMSFKDTRFVQYLISSKAELKKVSWPTRKETTKHTLIVIGISLFVAIFLGVLDIAFARVLSLFI